MKRGEERQEAQKMPSSDEEAIGRIGIVMRPETSASVPWLPEAFGRPGAPADSRPAPPRSKAKAGDLAGCLLRRKAFRKPPQRRRLSEGLGHRRTASPLVHQPWARPPTSRYLENTMSNGYEDHMAKSVGMTLGEKI
ncbi:hypothetical protein QTO34_016213 [Cnephaeus nilssonii]|uniref:Uncharacterized protein n=1 Tax=Cnephaeus nilssonii TaxID=3371016 RepID=A0AA40I5I7_CNENI|nr:hypothetical protein QTO34_016213 [Eptesicus nilssonii]